MADDYLMRRIEGTLKINGKGDVRKYIEKATGLSYSTYCRRIKDPSSIDLFTFRKLVKLCGMTETEVLKIVC